MNKKGLIALIGAGVITVGGAGVGGGVMIGKNSNNTDNTAEDVKSQIVEVNEDLTARLTKSTKEYIKELTGLELDVDNSSWDATATIEKKGKEFNYIISGTAKKAEDCQAVDNALKSYVENETDEQLLEYMKKVLNMVKNSKDIKAEQTSALIEAVDVTVGTVTKTMIAHYNENQDFKKVDEVTNIVTHEEVKDDDLKVKNTVVGIERADAGSADKSKFDVFVSSTFAKKVFTMNYVVELDANATASAVKDIIQKCLNDNIVDEGVNLELKTCFVEEMSLTPSIFSKVNSMDKEATVQAGA